MDALQVDDAFSSGKATLLVLLPDAVESRLIGPIERWIRDQTSCVPIARHAFRFTGEALERFYPGLAARIPEHWGLLCSVFSAGPSLATLWFGEKASELIPALKGETHPARCPASTLRGRFWCDNTIANLVHASDDRDEAVRELAVLRSLAPAVFQGPVSTRGLAPYSDPGPAAPRHSGILTLCSLVAQLRSNRGVPFRELDLPAGGEARETMDAAESWLAQALASDSTAISRTIQSYVDGTAEASELVAALRSALHVGSWQELMLRCGLASRPGWLEAQTGQHSFRHSSGHSQDTR
jgi:nucleoside diphosphate kinase